MTLAARVLEFIVRRTHLATDAHCAGCPVRFYSLVPRSNRESFAELSEISKRRAGDGIQDSLADSPPSWSSRRPRRHRRNEFSLLSYEVFAARVFSFFTASRVAVSSRRCISQKNASRGDGGEPTTGTTTGDDDRQTDRNRRSCPAKGKEVRNTGENTSRSPITFRKNRPVGKTKEKTPGGRNRR